MNQKRNRLRKFIRFMFLVGFLIGLGMLSYPLVSNTVNNKISDQLYNAYLRDMSTRVQAEEVDLSSEWQKAWDYNKNLEPIILPDSFVQATNPYTNDEPYTDALNITGDGIMGYLEIPKIDIRVAIYHSTDDDVLEKGAGHLHGSSLPAGGEGHAVIAAHRGLPNASLFTDLDQLEIGDQFYLDVLDETLAYEVDQIKIVEPTETDDLQVVPGQDLVTLLTCTPYGVNTQRLLVRGHRVPYVETVKPEQARHVVHSANTSYLFLVICGVSIAVLFMLIVYGLKKNAQRKKHRRKRAA